MSGIKHLSQGIIEDLGRRLPGQRKTQREKLGLLVATMLDVRSANLMDCAPRGDHLLTAVGLTEKAIPTNIAIIQEPGHDEPWIIALSQAPSTYKALDYGLRWGIEAMFSDFKTRGFGLEDTQIRYPERLARLILVMALALYWAVSTGMWDCAHNAVPAEKKTSPRGRKSSPEA